MKPVRAVSIALIALVLLGTAAPGWAGAPLIVTGTGNFVPSGTRTSVGLDPACVSLVTRVGLVTFSGLITVGAPGGSFVTQSMVDTCATPTQGPFQTTIRLDDVTVGGLMGGLVIELHGVFEGDLAGPTGTRVRGHGTVTGASGQLKRARGVFQFVGSSTTSSSSNTYFAEIQLK